MREGVRRPVSLPVLSLGALLLLGACGHGEPDDGVACTAVFVYGLTVQVRDAATGGLVATGTLTLREGSYVEVMDSVIPGDYVGAGERAGTYELTVEAPGYVTQVVPGIVIGADVCHVIPEVRTVHLVPL